MLSHIHIRNLAIVDEIDVELDAGMTALTGETGAGKSILVDALGLALGDRADDITWRLRWGEDWLYVYLLLEFQSTIDAWMAVRIQIDIGEMGRETGRGFRPRQLFAQTGRLLGGALVGAQSVEQHGPCRTASARVGSRSGDPVDGPAR